MKIYDKAKWQMDGGMEKKMVIEHFECVFRWLLNHHMLSEDGQEMLESGIDGELSLNTEMVTKEGADFLDMYYDDLIKQSSYDIVAEQTLMDSYFDKYQKQIKQ